MVRVWGECVCVWGGGEGKREGCIICIFSYYHSFLTSDDSFLTSDRYILQRERDRDRETETERD